MSKATKNTEISTKSFLISMDGLQKLSLALLPFAIALLSYAFIGISRSHQTISDEINLRVEELEMSTLTLNRENKALGIITGMVNRMNQRSTSLLEAVEADLKDFSSIIQLQRMELKKAQGALQQFSIEMYPNLHKLTTSLEILMVKEGAVLQSMQEFLVKRNDKTATSEEREDSFQNLKNDSLELARANSAQIGAYKLSLDHFELSREKVSLKNKRLYSKFTDLKRTIYFFGFLFCFSLLLIVILCLGVIGIRLRKKEPPRIVLP